MDPNVGVERVGNDEGDATATSHGADRPPITLTATRRGQVSKGLCCHPTSPRGVRGHSSLARISRWPERGVEDSRRRPK